MSITMTETDAREVRAQAVRTLEAEFSELITQFRRVILENAHRLSPGMLPGAYKVFTTIVRRDHVTISALAETLMADKGQISRTVRELENLGLVVRTPDPSDGRSSILTATPEGLERLDAARNPRESALADSLESWDVADIERLAHLLRALTSGTAPDPAEKD